MSLFRKKKQEAPEAPTPVIRSPCEIFGHTWKDFPAYMTTIWDRHGESSITITEPYVCLCCKQRKDVPLLHFQYYNINRNTLTDIKQQYEQEYASILKPRGIIEDMINDVIYVDREKLDAWERLHGNAPEKKEFKFKIPGEQE